MYLANYDNGWELLSADLRVPRVFAYGETGNISVRDLYSNLASSDFFSKLCSGMSDIINDSHFTSPEFFSDSWRNRSRVDSIDVTIVRVRTVDTLLYDVRYQDHLMSTKWGLRSPWNQYAPFTDYTLSSRCETGCVPVASAQVLYYLHSLWDVPSSSFSNAYTVAYAPNNSYVNLTCPGNVVFLNESEDVWDDMPLDSTVVYGAGSVSTLMVHLGCLYQADYYADGTYAYTSDAVSVFPNYGISCQGYNLLLSNEPIDDMATIFEEQIYENQLPVIMSLAYQDNSSGHCVVVDGYNYRNISIRTTTEYYFTGLDGIIQPGQLPDHVSYSYQNENSTFVAVNWGYNGKGDSINGSTIWYNLFTSWVVTLDHYSNYSSKRYLVYGFEII